MLKVVSDILLSLDSGNLAVLILLDLSAAFDSVDHATLIQRLRASYGLDGTVIKWFESYLQDRSQHVRLPATCSSPLTASCGLPQGSVLGPILFITYSADLLKLIKRHHLTPHAFADDSQIYGFCKPTEVDSLIERVSVCIDEVSRWMGANRLQMNHAKTEVIWLSSPRRQQQIPTEPIRIVSSHVMPSRSVRDLGVLLDADAGMRNHVTATVRKCFAALRQILSV